MGWGVTWGDGTGWDGCKVLKKLFRFFLISWVDLCFLNYFPYVRCFRLSMWVGG